MVADQILAEVRGMLIEIIGTEYALSLDIGMHSSFDADLEVESIEFVKLAIKLTEHYGDRVDLVAFLANKGLDEIIEMTVGDVVAYIADCQRSANQRGDTADVAAPFLMPAGTGALDG